MKKDVIVYSTEMYEVGKITKRSAIYLVKKKRAKQICDKEIVLFMSLSQKRKIKSRVFNRDNNICYICGDKIDKRNLTIDHVIPKSRLGLDNDDNFKCCCKRCNSNKNNMTIHEYLYFIKNNRNKYSYISNNQLEKLEVFYGKEEVCLSSQSYDIQH